MSEPNKQEALLKDFVEHLAESKGEDVRIDRWPDRENRTLKDIDAIAGCYAIEHTSVDTIPDQRERDALFVKLTDGLEEELSPLVSCWLSIALPYEEVRRRDDWQEIRATLIRWVRDESPNMPNTGNRVIRVEVGGLPFKLLVSKRESKTARVVFMRTAPDDESLPNRVAELVRAKADKLKPYSSLGYTSLLLLESDDIALMNIDKLVRALKEGLQQQQPGGIDEIWYADTSNPQVVQFENITDQVWG